AGGAAEGREPAADGLVQDPRGGEQARLARGGRAGGRGGRRLGRQPCAGRGVGGPGGGRARDDLRPAGCADGQGRGDEELRGRGGDGGRGARGVDRRGSPVRRG